MLIYNFQKEFVGIDEKDLATLGFKNLGELRSEAADFADLFVKTPGYIHNFKHVHWIDFITCAESNDESKVIINVNNKNYRCILNITTAFLVDNPSSKAYMINLNHLRELTHEESERISGDIVERQTTEGAPEPQAIFNTPNASEPLQAEENIVDEYDTPLDVKTEDMPLDIIIEDSFDDVPQQIETSFEEETSEIVIEDSFAEVSEFDEKLNIDLDIDTEIDEPHFEAPVTTQKLVQENFDNGYIYDPALASHELGLPVDLIEEFIQDFIDQAKEFKDELYKSVDENDLDKLKILSHKLKGVAANLRVEDALEMLTIVNTSNDINVIRDNLDTFYKIISKLAGEEITVAKEITIEKEEESSFIELPEQKIEIDIQEEEDLYSDPIEIIDEPKFADEENDLLDIDFKIDLDEEPEEVEIEIVPEVAQIPIEYSKNTIANEIGLDIESFNTLFDDYINEAEEITQLLKSTVANEDFQLTKSEALKLRGMSENMRINIFSTQFEILLSSEDSQDLQKAIEEITNSLKQLSQVGV